MLVQFVHVCSHIHKKINAGNLKKLMAVEKELLHRRINHHKVPCDILKRKILLVIETSTYNRKGFKFKNKDAEKYL